MHQQPPDPLDLPCACTALRKASRAVGRLYDASLAEAGLSANQLSILRHLARNGPQPLSRVADAMVMDRTSLYRALAPMTREGWVSTADSPNGRAKLGTLTAEGRRVMDAAADRWDAAQSRFVGDFGVAEWQALLAMLEVAIETATTAATGPAGERRP